MGYQVAFICEGHTDTPVLEAVVEAVLGDDFEPLYLQPERDMLTDAERWSDGGDDRVRAFCEQRHGSLAFAVPTADIVVVHLDADRCAKYSASDTSALCKVIKGWLGSSATDERLVIAIPAQATEAWLVAVVENANPSLENLPHPAERLAGHRQLSRNKAGQPIKDRLLYANLAETLRDRLPTVREVLPELDRFAGKLEAQRERLATPSR